MASPFSGFEAMFSKLADDLDQVTGTLEEIADMLSGLMENVGKAASKGDGKSSGPGGSGGAGLAGAAAVADAGRMPAVAALKVVSEEVSKAFATFKSSLSALTAPAQALSAGFGQIASSIGPFVSALNPSLMQQLGQSLRGLQATIGVALQPVAAVISNLARQVSDILLPAMQALAPIVQNISQAFASVLAPYVALLSDMLQAIAPVLELLSGVLRAFAEALQVYYTVLRSVFDTFVQTLSSLFGGVGLKDALRSFRDALREVVKDLVQLLAFIARSLGADGFIDNLVANFRKLAQPAAGMAAAPTGGGMAGAESIMKELAAAAFVAQGGTQDVGKSEKQYLEELVKAVREIKNGKDFREWLKGELANLPAWVQDGLKPYWTMIVGILGSLRVPKLGHQWASAVGGVNDFINPVQAINRHVQEAAQRNAP